jgi:hypothetical protein
MLAIFMLPGVFASGLFGGLIAGFFWGAFGETAYGYVCHWLTLFGIQVAKFCKRFQRSR